MDEDDLIDRLHEFGAEPMPAVTRDHVLTRVSATPARTHRRWRTRVLVGGIAALLVGTGGLASAGALPDSAQEVAYNAFRAVGIDVPPGHERYNDPVECPGGPYKNHGDYVRQHPDDPDAGKSPCGKPVKSLNKGNGNGRGNGNGKGNGVGKDKTKDETDTDDAEDEDTTTTTESEDTTTTTESEDLTSTTADPEDTTTTTADPEDTTTTTDSGGS